MWKSFSKKPEASETSGKQAWNEWDINQEDDVGINRSIQRPIEEKEKPVGELSVAHLADYMGDSEGLKNDVFKMFHYKGRAVYWFSTYKFTQREDMKAISEWQNRRPAWPTGQHKTDGRSDRKGEGQQEGNVLIPPNLRSKTQRTESSLESHGCWVDVLKQQTKGNKEINWINAKCGRKWGRWLILCFFTVESQQILSDVGKMRNEYKTILFQRFNNREKVKVISLGN